VSALLHEGEVARCVAEGHEIGLHGWIHERNTALDPAEERDLLFRAADVLEGQAGVRPVGLRTPSWDFSAATLALAREAGLRYDSSLMADDDCYELLADGEPTGLVELPVEWIRDDAPYFTMDRFTALRPYASPRAVAGIWRDEFDAARAEGGLFQLTMHPHVIGHRSRMAVLTELLDHIAAHDDVWFATHAQVVDHVLGASGATGALGPRP
jgi:peptidoglycan/xylan/chitin deacetylase (PgdA/CDA1 family)